MEGTYGPFAHLGWSHLHQILENKCLEAPAQQLSNFLTVLWMLLKHFSSNINGCRLAQYYESKSSSGVPSGTKKSYLIRESHLSYKTHLMHLDTWRVCNSSQIFHDLHFDCT